jgi:hypothetical protein
LFGSVVDGCFVIEDALSGIAGANFLKDLSRAPELASPDWPGRASVKTGSGLPANGLRVKTSS